MRRLLWSTIVKPLLSPLVGWERGSQRVAREPGRNTWEPIPRSELFDEEDRYDTDTATQPAEERWLRSSEAWDAVVRPLLARLHDADPANGHGIERNRR